MEKPRLRHPGLSLVRRGAGWASPKAMALRPSRTFVIVASGAPPALDLASGRCARCAHFTAMPRSVKYPGQVIFVYPT
jgi:hypothetical protein